MKKKPLLGLSLNKDKIAAHMDEDEDEPKEKKIPDKIVQVAPRLFLSGAKAASNLAELEENKINVILCLIPTRDLSIYPDKFHYINNPISDNVSQDISEIIIELPRKLKGFVNQGKNVLVHCQEVD